jgi:hypothetical protein
MAYPKAQTGTAAAATGGVTTFIPYVLDTGDTAQVFEEVRRVTEAGARIDFGLHFVVATEAQLAAVAEMQMRIDAAGQDDEPVEMQLLRRGRGDTGGDDAGDAAVADQQVGVHQATSVQQHACAGEAQIGGGSHSRSSPS